MKKTPKVGQVWITRRNGRTNAQRRVVIQEVIRAGNGDVVAVTLQTLGGSRLQQTHQAAAWREFAARADPVATT